MLLWLKCWWHQKRRFVPEDTAPAGDGAILTNCSCGGYAQCRFDGNRLVVEQATCPVFVRKLRQQS